MIISPKKILILFFAVFLLFSGTLSARSRKDYFLKPQVGLWFGPITPVGTTADLVDTNLGVGGFFRYNTPFKSLKVGFDTSYQHYKSRGVNDLTVVPLYGSAVYLIPLDFPVRFQAKAGFGTSWVSVKPDNVSQWDPVLMLGTEISFPAGRTVNIGLRLEYLYLIEKAGAGGHLFNTVITLYFNL